MHSRLPSLRLLGVCAIITIFGLFFLFRNAPEDLGNFALGQNTVSVFPRLDGDKIHCSTMVDGEDCLGPALNRQMARGVLWLGNSQLHAINQWQEGEVPASAIAAKQLRNDGVDLLAFSQPNASLKEHLAVFASILPVWKPDILVLPLVFDDTREGNVRADISQGLASPEAADILSPYPYGAALMQTYGGKSSEDSGGSANLQAVSESFVTALLERCCGWESLRKRVRGAIWISIYKFRNTVFGIGPTSVRKKIPGIYRDNLAAFETILALSKEQGITVLTYIAPIRNDVKIPYAPQEYAQFKRDVGSIAASYGVHVLNLENLVPNELWGEKDSTGAADSGEIDFMHFQAAGHIILGTEISRHILDLINDI